jgi:hypothetical protein
VHDAVRLDAAPNGSIAFRGIIPLPAILSLTNDVSRKSINLVEHLARWVVLRDVAYRQEEDVKGASTSQTFKSWLTHPNPRRRVLRESDAAVDVPRLPQFTRAHGLLCFAKFLQKESYRQNIELPAMIKLMHKGIPS